MWRIGSSHMQPRGVARGQTNVRRFQPAGLSQAEFPRGGAQPAKAWAKFDAGCLPFGQSPQDCSGPDLKRPITLAFLVQHNEMRA
jgi:hypothetical protein